MYSNKRIVTAVFLLALIVFSACEKESDIFNNFHNNDVNDIIKFIAIDKDSISADGESQLNITVQITPEADSPYRKVSFSTNYGLFSNQKDSITAPVNYTGQCSVSLTSSKHIGPTIIKAKVKDIVIDTLVYFMTSYPEDFLLSASDYVVDSGNISSIKVDCYRKTGQVTNNLKVLFSVQKVDTINIYPVIDQFGLVENDTASVEIFNPFHAQGKYTIIAKAPISDIDTLTKCIVIQFN
jgi:hypothetical protein